MYMDRGRANTWITKRLRSKRIHESLRILLAHYGWTCLNSTENQLYKKKFNGNAATVPWVSSGSNGNSASKDKNGCLEQYVSEFCMRMLIFDLSSRFQQVRHGWTLQAAFPTKMNGISRNFNMSWSVRKGADGLLVCDSFSKFYSRPMISVSSRMPFLWTSRRRNLTTGESLS